MAIIETGLRRLRDYPFRAIEQKAADKLISAAGELEYTGDDPELLIHLLECYCDFAGILLTEDMLTSTGMAPTHDGFCGALISGKLVDIAESRIRRFCRAFALILLKLHIKFPSMQGEIWLPQPFTQHVHQWSGNKIDLPAEKVSYWQGWPIENKRRRIKYLNLASLYHTHGKNFVAEFHRGVRIYVESHADQVDQGYMRIVKHLVANPVRWPPETFKDPINIYNFFVDLIKKTFKGKNPSSRSTINRGHRWDRHISELHRSFINPRIWASPYRPLPLTGLKPLRGGSTHINKTATGKEVRTKLITPIPLHVTQAEAIHILATRISGDVSIVREWATRKTQEVMRVFHKRKELAKADTKHTIGDAYFWTSNPVENIAALFEAKPYAIDWRLIIHDYGSNCGVKCPSKVLSKALGIPCSKDIYPFQCLLILEHPLITDSFLMHFDLYDKNGDICGIIKEGGKSYLASESGSEATIMSGSKPRRGVNHSRQKFELSPTSVKIIEDLIALTQQARDYLKSIGDDNWRKLFIASSSGMNKPKPSPTPRWNKSQIRRIKSGHPEFIKEFSEIMLGSTIDEVIEFVSNVTPSSIRASRCVEIYLQTGKTDIMQQCLGHDKQNSKLLESYLPEVFVRLLESRSIQVVQKVIICCSLRDSPFLVEGANFDTLEELEVFLENYTSKELPAYLTDPDGIDETQISEQADEIIIRIGTGSLVALLSLRDAVNSIDDHRLIPISFLKWADVADMVEKDIESGFNRVLKRKLAEAKPMINPEPFVKKISEKQR